MMFKTHLAFGFLIGLISLSFFNIENPILFVSLVTIFSSLPDIDHPKSKISRKLFFISLPISLVFKHRGFFHSIFPPLILFFGLVYFNFNFLAIAVFIGYISHLLGDAITKEGINFLHPISTFKIQGPLTTGATLELFLFMSIIIMDILYVVKAFILV